MTNLSSAHAQVSATPGGIEARTPTYTWTWDRAGDTFALKDEDGRCVVTGPQGPVVVVAVNGVLLAPIDATVQDVSEQDSAVAIISTDDRSGLRVRTRWVFETDHVRLEAVELTSDTVMHVVDMTSFATVIDGTVTPGLRSDWVVHPGPNNSPVLGPVIPSWSNLDLRLWLGRGSGTPHDDNQQWALPAHYFAGMSVEGGLQTTGAFSSRLSSAYCLGLAEMPNADHLFRMTDGRYSPVFQVRSDLWGQTRTGSGPIRVGPAQLMTLGSDYRDAIRSYYAVALRTGSAVRPRTSPAKADTLRRSAWNTWGAQTQIGPEAVWMDQALLESIYDDARAAGLRPGMFVVDAKWEGTYGVLEHDANRLPRFEEFLGRVRADGLKIGMWAAFMRCENPSAVGLTDEHMIRGRDGAPISRQNWLDEFYLYDASHPRTREVLRGLVRKFAERYRPDLVKFDFGYEIPSLAETIPHDPSWGGEKILRRCLEVIVGELRSVLPDVVVMYYHLSPLMNDLVDLVAPDDLFVAMEETHLSTNRRVYLSSPLAELGVPYYSSSGYDCASLQQIWFDAALAGPVGALVGFRGDVWGARPSAEDVACFNGISDLTRPATVFTFEPHHPNRLGGSQGATAASWVRREQDEVVGAAIRTMGLDGLPVAAEIPGVAATTAQVVVLSTTDAPLARTSGLGVVPFGEGRLSLRREEDAEVAHIRVRLLGGASSTTSALVTDSRLGIDLMTHIDGVPVERIEVTISENASSSARNGGWGRR